MSAPEGCHPLRREVWEKAEERARELLLAYQSPDAHPGSGRPEGGETRKQAIKREAAALVSRGIVAEMPSALSQLVVLLLGFIPDDMAGEDVEAYIAAGADIQPLAPPDGLTPPQRLAVAAEVRLSSREPGAKIFSAPAKQVARAAGVSEQSVYSWRKRKAYEAAVVRQNLLAAFDASPVKGAGFRSPLAHPLHRGPRGTMPGDRD